jgi:hypothetical protein
MPGYPLKITDAGDQKSRLYFAFITQYLLGTSALVEVSLSVPLCAGQGRSTAEGSARLRKFQTFRSSALDLVSGKESKDAKGQYIFWFAAGSGTVRSPQ